MEVKFRIGEKVEGTHGGQDLYPHESQLPYGLRKEVYYHHKEQVVFRPYLI